MKKRLAILLSLILALLLCACSATSPIEEAAEPAETAESAAPGNEDIRLAIIPDMIAGSDFWTILIPACQDYCEEKGYYLYTEDCRGDAAVQMNAIENALSKGCESLFIAAVDPEGLDSYVCDLMDQGIYIMANTAMPNTSCYITVDQYSSGATCAEQAIAYIQENFGGAAEIGILTNSTSGQSIDDRIRGITDTLEAAIESGEIAGSSIVAQVDALTIEDSMTATENMLTANPDMKVLIGWSDGVISGAYEAVKGTAGIDPNFAIFTAGDGVNAALELIAEDSYYKTTIVFDMNVQKQCIVDVMAAMVRGDFYAPVNSLPETIGTAENAKDLMLIVE